MPSVRLLAPKRCAERLAYTDANADSDSHNQHDDEDLGDDFVARAKLGQAGAGVALLLGLLSLFLPMVLSRPYRAVHLGIHSHAFPDGLVKGAVRVESFNVCFEGIDRFVGMRVGCDASD